MTNELSEQFSLDEIYVATAFIFHEKNEKRSIESTYSHLVEHCSVLAKLHVKGDYEGSSIALKKCFAWLLPLMAKARIRSVERIIYRKFPGVCYYCQSSPHIELNCKQVHMSNRQEADRRIQRIFAQSWDARPRTMRNWQRMFAEIYPKTAETRASTIIKLFEELGELAEAIRVFDHNPCYFLSEAADIFSYLYAVSNEIELVANLAGDLEFRVDDFVRSYPGQCMQCGSVVCICPHLPKATVGRISKEIQINDEESLFSSQHDLIDRGRTQARLMWEAIR